MPGTIIMIVILVLSPVFVAMGTTAVAALLGWAINDAVDANHEGTALLAMAYAKPNDTDS